METRDKHTIINKVLMDLVIALCIVNLVILLPVSLVDLFSDNEIPDAINVIVKQDGDELTIGIWGTEIYNQLVAESPTSFIDDYAKKILMQQYETN